MKILIDVPDDFSLEEGDAFSAVQTALEHFEIPSTIRVVTRAVAIELAQSFEGGNAL